MSLEAKEFIMNAVIDAILTRRSVRSYRPDPVPPADLDTILLAGSYAPNGKGLQNWKFTAIASPERLRQVNEAIRQALLPIPVTPETHPYVASLIEKAQDESAEFLYGAPALVIVSHLSSDSNAMANSALAIGSMMLAAHSLGLGSCWLNQLPGLAHLPPVLALLSELGIPEEYQVYGSMALGYPAEEPKPAAPRKEGVITVIR